MAKIKIARNVLAKATERSVLSTDEKAQVTDAIGAIETLKGSIYADLAKLPMPFIWALLDD